MRGTLPNGNEIRSLRTTRGLTQANLAQLAKLDIKTARKAEKCVRLDFDTLRRIADALEVELSRVRYEADCEANLHQRLVEKWCELFEKHDLSGLLQVYHPDAILTIPGEADVPCAGRFQGREQIAQAHQLSWQLKQEPTNLDDCTFLIADAGITFFGPKGYYLPNGELQYFTCVHVFAFLDKMIYRHDVQYDTLEFTRQLDMEQ